ncbi:MAG TPA: DUF4126 domain-containing protein [Anaerolineales bacterium]|nr:DUF4126 domain-containing protein [Anaerolineales bacterium]
MDLAGGLLTAFGLAASAGLNAYIPLLIVALLGRFTTWFTLNSPWDALSSWWVIGALALLTLIEFFADKAPAVNHANDVIQTFVRPAAGAVLFAASAGAVSNINPIVAMVAGLLVAGGVHTVKAAAVRPVVTATTGGLGNLPVSLAEDVAAVFISIAAIVVPVVIAAILIVMTSLFVWWLWRGANTVPRSST